MTRAEAKAEVQNIWDFKEVGDLIAVRDAELIKTAERVKASQSVSRNQEPAWKDRSPYATPNT